MFKDTIFHHISHGDFYSNVLILEFGCIQYPFRCGVAYTMKRGDKMADGSITISTALDNKQLEKELNKLKKDIGKLEESIAGQESKKSPLIQHAQELEQKMKSARSEVERYRAAWAAGVSGADKEQSTAIAKTHQLEAEHAKVVGQIDKIDAKLLPAYEKMSAMKERAGGIAKGLGKASINSGRMGEAVQRAGKSLDRFKMRLKEVVRSALVFTLITQALAQFRNWMGKVIKSNAEASVAVAKLKGALLTLAQPLLNVILPAFTMFVNVLTNIITKISTLVSTLFGTTIDSSKKAAEGLYDQTNAIKATGSAAKKASKYLAGFDEINKISADNTSTSSGGGADGIKPDFSGFETDEIKGKVDELTTYLMGSLLALGAILAFTGVNIPLGITLMAVGAIGLATEIAVNWSSMSQGLREAITKTLVVLGTASLVIGAILALSGANMPLGIGLMISGAAMLGTAAALNWDAISEALKGPMGSIVAAISVELLALGAILAFSGSLPLGIALMALGAANLATVVALNWNAVSNALRGPIGKTTAIASGALLALGVLLAFTGVALPLGIALIAVGAVGLTTVTALNWDSISTALQGPIGEVVAMVSGALIVIGLILALTGVALPLGIALIAAGAVGLVTVGALNWDAITDKLKEVWANIKNWWNTSVSKFFTADFWKGLGRDMLNGLFNGLSAIGSKINEWGSNFINGVKDFFGIHSPSTEFESLGGYMMAGLQNGVTDNIDTTELAFSTMFTAIVAIEENAISLMKTALVLFLAYVSGDFATAWKLVWQSCYANSALNIRKVISEIDILNARLAAIERNIVITITTVHETDSGGSGSSGSGKAKSGNPQLRTFALPELPRLATGAVIPPNREFMAVLGDQKRGTNIEAPMSTIEQGVENVLRRMGISSGQSGMTLVLDGNLAALAGVLRPYMLKEGRRIGVNLTKK